MLELLRILLRDGGDTNAEVQAAAACVNRIIEAISPLQAELERGNGVTIERGERASSRGGALSGAVKVRRTIPYLLSAKQRRSVDCGRSLRLKRVV